jgi:hypothetical protein
MMSLVNLSRSALEGKGVEQAVKKDAMTAANWEKKFTLHIYDSLALDGRCDGFTAFAVHAHVDAQSNRGITAKQGVREALLTIAIVQAQLHAPHLPIGHTVSGPSAKAIASAWIVW